MKIFTVFGLVLSALFSPFFYCTGISPLQLSSDDSVKIIEKVYLHTDRVSYYPGEDIWFKAYLIDASDRFLSDHSNNLHVELISPGLKIIDSHVVKLSKGLGNGDLRLSGKLASGRYRLRAYSNYMRNFGDQLFFNKDITIINPADASKELSDSNSYTKKKLEITFFPEGGSLVDNVTSTVAFKALDGNGYASEVSGEIYSSTGERVTEFRSSHKGMGTFKLTPVPGLKYYALSKNQDGESIRSEIPVSFSTGVALGVTGKQVGLLSLIFKTNSETLPLLLDNDLSLTVSVRNLAFKTYSFRMKSPNSYFNLPTDDLPGGIAMLTLSGLNDKPLCERLVFIQNEEDVRVNVESDKSEYNKRDSVLVKISLIVNSRVPQDAFLSISAAENIFTDNSSRFQSTISSWFLLESDVRGQVEESSYYFDPSNPDRLRDLDLLLLTQGWRDFEWKYKNLEYPAENGFTISGRVRKKFTDVPLNNIKINLAIFKSGNPLIVTVQPDTSGRFQIDGVDVTGKAKVIASVTSDKNNLKGWLLLDSLRYAPALFMNKIAQSKSVQEENQDAGNNQLISENQLTQKNLHTFIQHAEIKNSIQKKYKLSDTITPGEVIIVARRQDAPESARTRSRQYLMGTPDQELVITPDLQIYNDVFQLVGTRYLSGRVFHPAGMKARPLPPSSQSPEMQNPLYMINGMVATEEDVRTLSVSEVERIDVLDNMATYGVFGAGQGDTPIDGVISIILKSNFADKHTSVYHSVNIKFSGYNEPRLFYSPTHHSTLEKDYKPDLRTTLFWEPNIKVENNKNIFLNYFNADNPSKVKVIVEGITTSGIPVTGKAEYEVK